MQFDKLRHLNLKALKIQCVEKDNQHEKTQEHVVVKVCRSLNTIIEEFRQKSSSFFCLVVTLLSELRRHGDCGENHATFMTKLQRFIDVVLPSYSKKWSTLVEENKLFRKVKYSMKIYLLNFTIYTIKIKETSVHLSGKISNKSWDKMVCSIYSSYSIFRGVGSERRSELGSYSFLTTNYRSLRLNLRIWEIVELLELLELSTGFVLFFQLVFVYRRTDGSDINACLKKDFLAYCWDRSSDNLFCHYKYISNYLSVNDLHRMLILAYPYQFCPRSENGSKITYVLLNSVDYNIAYIISDLDSSDVHTDVYTDVYTDLIIETHA